MKPYLQVTSDFTKDFEKLMKSFKNDEVLVGIPESDSPRQGDEINNATLLAIMNFGSEDNNIPAWPVMAIGIRDAQEQIAEEFKKAVTGSLKAGLSAVTKYYERAGIIASNSIKKVINAQEGVPSGRPLKETLIARKRDGHKGNKYWIVTGQLRNAITYVVKGD